MTSRASIRPRRISPGSPSRPCRSPSSRSWRAPSASPSRRPTARRNSASPPPTRSLAATTARSASRPARPAAPGIASSRSPSGTACACSWCCSTRATAGGTQRASSTGPLTSARKEVAVLVAIALAAYLPSLLGPFHFDDYNVVVNYPTVHSWSTFFERASGGVRALLKASYVLNWTIDSDAFGFHLVNIALHAANTVLLYFIGRRLIPDNVRNYSLLPALLFALHPMQTEAVTYISGRSSSLMATFYLGAILAYLRGAHWGWSCLLFALALATRETAVTLPAALLLI